MSRTGQPQKSEHGFVTVTHVRCPDCEIEGNLRNDGRPVPIGSQPLRGASRFIGVAKATSGCPTCGGLGSIATDDLEALMRAGISHPNLASVDPYALKSA